MGEEGEWEWEGGGGGGGREEERRAREKVRPSLSDSSGSVKRGEEEEKEEEEESKGSRMNDATSDSGPRSRNFPVPSGSVRRRVASNKTGPARNWNLSSARSNSNPASDSDSDLEPGGWRMKLRSVWAFERGRGIVVLEWAGRGGEGRGGHVKWRVRRLLKGTEVAVEVEEERTREKVVVKE